MSKYVTVQIMYNYSRKQRGACYGELHIQLLFMTTQNTKVKVVSKWILTFCEPNRVTLGGSKDLNSVIYKQMHIRTLLMYKPFLMSTKPNQKHTQIDEELVHSVLPLLK